jgi:hypothetical protein
MTLRASASRSTTSLPTWAAVVGLDKITDHSATAPSVISRASSRSETASRTGFCADACA